MQIYLNSVVQEILAKTDNLSNYTFILPSKRAGVFLKDELKSSLIQTTILPKIISIEEFIKELSNINSIDTTTLLFEFYHIYKQHALVKEIDSFDQFSTWATILLQDFNEIDRHLIDPKYIFGYLKDIKRLEELLKGEQKTELIKNRFRFFEKLETYYTAFYKHLLEKKVGYQGLQYREAVDNIHFFINNITETKIVFVGFNALNKAEEKIFQELLNSGIATIYWDIDSSYYNSNHSASSFIKKYHKNWAYYKNNPLNWMTDSFSSKKNIKIIGTPKNTSQIKYAGEVLATLHNTTENYKNTALVLADESLLTSTLNSLPKDVKNVNITMGYELKDISLANLFEALFKLHINNKKDKFYYKNLLSVLNHSQINVLFNKINLLRKLSLKISTYNYTYITKPDLLKLSKDHLQEFELISFLFDNWNDNAPIAIDNCIKLIIIIQEKATLNQLEKEYVYRFYTIFQQLSNLNTTFGYITDIKTLYQFYKQLLQNEKLSFKGEPLSGLQIMGMLETRVLDFKNLIITSVNEGILPASKSDNSFIPFDIKKEVGLPTYQEKDAIFSYHFFRLLQRAENIYLIYNTEADVYGSGEQSRFLTQLEILKENEIEKFVVSPKVNKTKNKLKQLLKNKTLLRSLKQLAERGFSPTTLTTYILNPFEFYKQKILKIREVEEVEETIAANTLGTIIHKTLEVLYIPFIGKYLTEGAIKIMKTKVSDEVKKWFIKEYGNNITSGKNLLIYKVAHQFIDNFLTQEIALIRQGKQTKIIALEHDLETSITIEGLNFPIHLKGQADRIDEVDGVIRIIDYKTGKVTQPQLIIKNWDLLTSDYKYSKSFQVLFYALLYTQMNTIDLDSTQLESGIISFKNLKSRFLKVNKNNVSKDDLDNFTIQLKQLILEIFDTEKRIMEKETPFT
ncbi:MAG: PD-(D/E)XK nuclease family protein [Flavobacteriaceae bacterium]|nr:PD-(D/E)XK nuclease family protein [Flavobacteriaceae bacterium]